MTETSAPKTPVEPKPAASVVLVRDAAPGSPEPLEVYMIRRNRNMRFLGGYYAFPGGKVDPGDGAPEALARCRGIAAAEAEALFTGHEGTPALAFWVTAVRELLADPRVRELYAHEVEKVNAHLPGFEKIVAWELLPSEWTLETGELTPTQKVKRRVINQKYGEVIDRLYAEAEAAQGGS